MSMLTLLTSPARCMRSRFYTNVALGCILFLPHFSVAQVNPTIAKVSVSAAGGLTLNGKQADLKAIEAEFRKLQAARGAVWYYRENGKTQEPTPQALAVLQLVVKYKLPISMSSKPDYSDYIDDDGYPQPRKP